MKIRLFVLLLILAVLNSNAQEFKLGKVSIAELKEKAYPNDTTAAAAILYKKGNTYFNYKDKVGFYAIHEYEFRIKIYKKEGLSWANFSVPYYVGYEDLDKDQVKFSNAITYNLENGVITKNKLAGEGNFKKNVNKYWNEVSITMPNVKVGSVIEFKYTVTSQNIIKFPEFYFQYDIPVSFVEYETQLHVSYVYKPIIKGLLKIKLDSKLAIRHSSYINEYQQGNTLEYEVIKSKYSAENIPALKDEKYVDNLQNYRSSLLQELEKTRFPEQNEKDYVESWEGVVKSIYKNKDFGEALKDKSYLSADVKRIVQNAATQEERTITIFRYVQNTMNWNKENGYSVDKGVQKAYMDRTGNTAEINFILISMLNYAGINAYPVLVSTIENGISIYPSRTGFNYVVAAVEIDGNQILLDATNKYTTQNILPLNTLNWTGRLIKEDGSSQEIDLVPKKQSDEATSLMATLDAKGTLTGKIRIIRTDYNALSFREKYSNENQEQYVENLENNLGKIEVNNYSIENKNANFEKPVVETFTFSSNNEVEIIGEKMYVNPLLFFTVSTNPLVQEKRELPIYFQYPKQEKYNIFIDIPQGYTIESLPQPIKITTGQDVGVFIFNSKVVDNKIQIAVTTSINKALISAEFYDVLKEFFQKTIDKQNEKIVLKKT
jgi:hypothetical protein